MARCPGAAFALLCLALLLLSSSLAAADESHQVYVVHMGGKCDKHESQIVSEHHEMLASVMGSLENAKDSIIYHYHRSFRGFSAKMALHHADALKEHDQVHSVFLSQTHFTHTTHSWQFLGVWGPGAAGLPTGTAYQYPTFTAQNDVIIGVLDTGYWPESTSFHGLDMPPPPARWKGLCIPGENFTADLCNNKVIGARHYYQGAAASGVVTDILSARDKDGHGTHCASTAAGRNVSTVGVYGIGTGTAVGGAPGARLAIYKVCNQIDTSSAGCTDADVLAAFDDALADGVDILSVSLGSPDSKGSHFGNGVALGSYHAAVRNVLVAASAGNDGPGLSTLGNTAPWLLTVASSTTDREYVTNLRLGDGTIIPGFGVINPFTPPALDAPIVLGANVPAFTSTSLMSSICAPGSLASSLVTGAIVACQYDPTVFAATEVLSAGGVGLILVGGEVGAQSQQFKIPTVFVTQEAARLADPYFSVTLQPVGSILKTEAVFGHIPAPVVSEFSSRGPSVRNPDILKPDITGPGQDILAAFSPLSLGSATGFTSEDWTIISGTSMSTPHLSGIAALIRAVHPSWSPAAIKSAIMTTAYQLDNGPNPSNYTSTLKAYPGPAATHPWAFGAGHVNPSRALDPGLVYDTLASEYNDFMCVYGITNAELQLVTGNPAATCPAVPVPHYNLNYPSISVSQVPATGVAVVRTVTNVGPAAAATYTARVVGPVAGSGVTVAVDPPVLQFTAVGQSLPFTVSIHADATAVLGTTQWAALSWSDGAHTVTSQILVTP